MQLIEAPPLPNGEPIGKAFTAGSQLPQPSSQPLLGSLLPAVSRQPLAQATPQLAPPTRSPHHIAAVLAIADAGPRHVADVPLARRHQRRLGLAQCEQTFGLGHHDRRDLAARERRRDAPAARAHVSGTQPSSGSGSARPSMAEGDPSPRRRVRTERCDGRGRRSPSPPAPARTMAAQRVARTTMERSKRVSGRERMRQGYEQDRGDSSHLQVPETF